MNLQYISDHTGKTTGVYITIEEWEALKSKFKGLAEEELREQTDEEILNGIKQAIFELNEVKKGKIKARPVNNLLDEL